MPAVAEERVLVVPTKRFHHLGHFQGFTAEIDKYLPALLQGGDVERLDWLMVADDILAADQLCCELMRIDPRRIGYLRDFARRHRLPPRDEYELSAEPSTLAGPRFRLQRDWLDYPGYFAFRSPVLAYLAYHSPVSAALHRVLYLFREKFYDHP